MKNRLLVGSILACTSLLVGFSSLGIILPPVKTVKLMWDYSATDSNIVFNVYGTTDLAAPTRSWTLLTNVPMTSCVLPMQSNAQFFTVAASNIVTGMQSDF
ncbi:MAG: hypothetical protein ACTHLW_02445 [Verrucomicrobiota bacterium]